jgi:hypothetical protein
MTVFYLKKLMFDNKIMKEINNKAKNKREYQAT